MLGQTKETWSSASYQGLIYVVTKYKIFVCFHNKRGKDACLANDSIDSSVNPRT
jgi:hypothetical protein